MTTLAKNVDNFDDSNIGNHITDHTENCNYSNAVLNMTASSPPCCVIIIASNVYLLSEKTKISIKITVDGRLYNIIIDLSRTQPLTSSRNKA